MSEEKQYEYRIAEFIWQCRVPMPLVITEESRNFITGPLSPDAESRNGANRIVFEITDQLAPVPEDAVFKSSCYFKEVNGEKVVWRCLLLEYTPYAELHFKANGDVFCRLLERGESELRFCSRLLNALNLENLLLARSAFLLHSCLIKHQDGAILFTAPSGTGKSTQGDLWTKYRGAEVLNGDRAGIYLKNGQWRATGLPYAGSSGIYRNENAPICAIVYLAQGPDNTVTRLSAGQAFRLLYPQINVHHWEPDFVTKISDLLIAFLNDIPVYYFSCTPDERAVEALEKQLMMV